MNKIKMLLKAQIPFVMVMVAAIGAMLGAGCEKQKIENPQDASQVAQQNPQQQQQSDTRLLSLNGYLHGEWHCEINDSTSIVLNIDTTSNTFSAFSENWNEHSGLLMGDGSVEHYYMNGDTLFVTQIDDMQISQNVTFPWLIRRISQETMEMFYLGFLPQGGIIHKVDYLYNR